MAYKTLSHVRDIIKAEELVKKLQDSILVEDTPALSAAEVGGIKVLLNKVIPDLKGVEVTGDLTGSIEHKLVQVEFVAAEDIKDS